MRITVVLKGAPNDKEAFQAAVRMAARQQGQVRVVLAGQSNREEFEKHLDFVLWDVRERLKLPVPPIVLESRLDRFELQEVAGRAGG
ncbi:MAG: hypothetical protein KGJ86_01410 [Chloroflexota bacterium]|nr:hypothetical protein [Chloroflexota bacterium]